MKTLSAFALTAALSAAIPVSTARAETISLSAPLAGATLHSSEIEVASADVVEFCAASAV